MGMRATAFILSGSFTTLVYSLVVNSTNQASVSRSTRVTSDVHLGDYIAFGLGIADESETASVASDLSDSLYTTTSHTAVSTTTTPSAALPTPASNTTHAHGTLTSKASTSSIDLEQCWNSWSGYWADLPNYGTDPPKDQEVCLYTYAPTTISRSSTQTESWADVLPSTVVWTLTRVIDANGFAPSTQYILNSYTNDYSKGTTWTSVTTWDYTQTESCYSTSISKVSTPPSPNCTLPTTQLSQCQASWETWIDHQLTPSVVQGTETSYFQDNLAPSCTQAAAGSALCTSLKDAYVSSRLNLAAFSRVLPSINRYAYISMSGGYYRTGNDPWAWPSSAYFAPSCTLGCGRCSIEGGTVQLLYWPPTTSTAGANASMTSEMPFVVETLGTTLTSPTLYVSYHSLYATDGCGSQVGTPIYDRIIAIPPESTLSSVWASPLGGAVVFYGGGGVVTATASLNVTDLHEPVPMSIYSSQPFCASYAQANAAHFQMNSWDCPRDSPYQPIIKLPQDLLRGLDPAWAECAEAYGGVYDPPKALRPVDAIAVPTNPAGNGESKPTPAAQASKPRPATAEPTRAASMVTEDVQPGKTSASAEGHTPGKPTPTQSHEASPETPDRTEGDHTPQDSHPKIPSNEPSKTPDETSASAGDHTAQDSPPRIPSGDTSKSPEEHQPGKTGMSDSSHNQGDSNQNGRPAGGDQLSDNNQAPTRDTRPPTGGASPTKPTPNTVLESGPAPSTAAGINAVSILESALHAAIDKINPYPKTSQSQASGSPPSSFDQDVPRLAGHDGASLATEAVIPAGVLHVGSDVYSQVQAQSGAVVIANAHSTITLSPGGPAVSIGAHPVSAAASDVFLIDSGPDQITTSLSSPGVPANGGQSLVGVLQVGSDAYSQIQAPAGVVVIANAHSTVTLSPGGPVVKIGSHSVSAAASDVFVVGSGLEQITTSLMPSGVSAILGQSLAAATAGAESASINAEPTNVLDQGVLTIGDQVLTAAIADGVLVYHNAETTVTLKPGHFPASVAGVALSEAASGRVVVGTGSDATTLALPTNPGALTIGTNVLPPVATQTGAVYANAKTTVSLGRAGSVTMIDGVRVNAAAAGVVVVGTGSDATAMSLPTRLEALTIGTHVLTPVATQTGAVYADAETTVSLGRAGSFKTIDGVRVSVAAAGIVVVGTGSDATTVTLATTGETSASLDGSASSTNGGSIKSTAGSVITTADDSMSTSDATSNTGTDDAGSADSAGNVRIANSLGWRIVWLAVLFVLLYT